MFDRQEMTSSSRSRLAAGVELPAMYACTRVTKWSHESMKSGCAGSVGVKRMCKGRLTHKGLVQQGNTMNMMLLEAAQPGMQVLIAVQW